MNEEIEPRDKNITVRVTASNHAEYKLLANEQEMTISTWVNDVLSNHEKIDEYYELKNQILIFLGDVINKKIAELDETTDDLESLKYPDSDYKRLRSRRSVLKSLITELEILRRRFERRFKNY